MKYFTGGNSLNIGTPLPEGLRQAAPPTPPSSGLKKEQRRGDEYNGRITLFREWGLVIAAKVFA